MNRAASSIPPPKGEGGSERAKRSEEPGGILTTEDPTGFGLRPNHPPRFARRDA
jgi:hypothetical protein